MYTMLHLQDAYDAGGRRIKCPPCCEQLFEILGHEPYVRGELVDARGNAGEDTTTETTTRTPDAEPTPTPIQYHGQSSKRTAKEFSLQSPVKKKSSKKSVSYDDCMSEFRSTCRAIQERVNSIGSSQERAPPPPPPSNKPDADTETTLVRERLYQDGYSEIDPFFHQAIFLCTNHKQRREFLRMTSPQGRYQYVTTVFPTMQMDSHSDAEELESDSDAEDMHRDSDAKEMVNSLEEIMSLLGDAFQLLRRLKMLKEMQVPKVNPPCPFPKLTGAQWLHLTMSDQTRCYDNLRMSRDAFLHLHHILKGFGLKICMRIAHICHQCVTHIACISFQTM
jgi:hypothetical protein